MTYNLSSILPHKANGEPVTVFVFDFTDKSPDKVTLHIHIYYPVRYKNLYTINVSTYTQIKLAQSAHLRLKTLRHPNVLKYIDGIEVWKEQKVNSNTFHVEYTTHVPPLRPAQVLIARLEPLVIPLCESMYVNWIICRSVDVHYVATL